MGGWVRLGEAGPVVYVYESDSMAIRTTSALVKGVLLKDYAAMTSPDLTPFMLVASAIVDDLVIYARQKCVTVDTVRQEIIERWLSAHSYQQSDPGYSSRSTEGSSGSFLGSVTSGVQSTRYGMFAIQIDPTGYLLTLGKRRATAAWLGKPPSQQIDIELRD